jgi:hypothetical protein
MDGRAACLVLTVGVAFACQSAPTNPPALQNPGNGSPIPHGTNSPPPTEAGAPAADGGLVTILASGVATPTAVALGPANVYWTDNAGGVWSVPRAGGSKTSLATGQMAPVAITVNATLGAVYWANAGNGAMGGGSIVGFDLSSSMATTLASGLVGPYAVASDSAFVYWTDQSSAQPGVDVTQVPVGGGPSLEIGTVIGDLAAGGLAIDPDNAYFASSLSGGGGSVATVPLAGGTPETLWESTAGRPTGVLVANSALYWLVSSAAPQGAVWAVALPGGKPTALASGLNSPAQLAVDASNAYWTSPNDGTVVGVALGGGTPATISTGLTAPLGIAVDDAIYVTTADSVIRITK